MSECSATLIFKSLSAICCDRPGPPPFLVALSTPAKPHLFLPLGGHLKWLVLISQSLIGLLRQVRTLAVQPEPVWEVLSGPWGLLV